MAAIEVSHLTKEYRLGALQSLKQSALNAGARLLGRPLAERPKFKALDDVSFSIEQGEVVGIIGHNGAGKSTLLKMLARISTPTSGSVKVNGRISPLIEVGAGFVPDFTGRENVYLNASILGMAKKEIDRKFDEIVDFAEMAEFIDTPVKRYSSGMQVKLAFAVATSIESEILIVDEVLAVGDLAFQRKCFDRIESLIKKSGQTVLLVSHNLRQVERLCSRAIMLDHGRILADDNKTTVCELFYSHSNAKIAAQVNETLVHSRHVRKTGELELTSIDLSDAQGQISDVGIMGDELTIRCRFHAAHAIAHPEVIIGFHTTDFFYIGSMGNGHIESRPDMQPGSNTIVCRIGKLPLMPGVYALRVGVLDGNGREMFYGEMLKTVSVGAGSIPQSKMSQLGVVYIPTDWVFDADHEQIRSVQGELIHSSST
jgi:lipopolysaccharide transport system ATP-binding protein